MNCYVLTGGASLRMGTAKADLELGGKSFFDRVIDAAIPAFDEVVAVTRSGEPSLPRIQTIHEPPHEGTSAIFGVRRALEHASDRAWIIGIDYPLVTSDLLTFLRKRFDESTAALLIPIWHGQAQFLCAGYSSSVVDLLDRMIRAGRLRLRELANESASEVVPEEEIRRLFEGEPLWNINLPDEYSKLRNDYGQ